MAKGSQHRCEWCGRRTCSPASLRGRAPRSTGSAGQEKGMIFMGAGQSPPHGWLGINHRFIGDISGVPAFDSLPSDK